MTQFRTVIQPEDKKGWQNWMDCMRSMVHELRSLKHPETTAILDRYECRECDYGFGLNVDWPDDMRKPDTETETPGREK